MDTRLSENRKIRSIQAAEYTTLYPLETKLFVDIVSVELVEFGRIK
jgi:hypothetical protein